MAKDDQKFSNLPSPPAPLFFNDKERALQKAVSTEINERVLGQQILYYAIDKERTSFHPIYGEAINKVFLPPVAVYASVEWQGNIITSETNLGTDTIEKVVIHFHNKRVQDDQRLQVFVGDFVLYGQRLFEIVSMIETRQLFGNIEHKAETSANCIQSRLGLLDISY